MKKKEYIPFREDEPLPTHTVTFSIEYIPLKDSTCMIRVIKADYPDREGQKRTIWLNARGSSFPWFHAHDCVHLDGNGHCVAIAEALSHALFLHEGERLREKGKPEHISEEAGSVRRMSLQIAHDGQGHWNWRNGSAMKNCGWSDSPLIAAFCRMMFHMGMRPLKCWENPLPYYGRETKGEWTEESRTQWLDFEYYYE